MLKAIEIHTFLKHNTQCKKSNKKLDQTYRKLQNYLIDRNKICWTKILSFRFCSGWHQGTISKTTL